MTTGLDTAFEAVFPGSQTLRAVLKDGVAADEPADGRTVLLVGITHLNKAQAEDLLDWLEANHSCFRRVAYRANDGFSVIFG